MPVNFKNPWEKMIKGLGHYGRFKNDDCDIMHE